MRTFNVIVHIFHLLVVLNFFLTFLQYISAVFKAVKWLLNISASSASYWKLEHTVGVHLLVPTEVALQHFCLNWSETVFSNLCFLQWPVNAFFVFWNPSHTAKKSDCF